MTMEYKFYQYPWMLDLYTNYYEESDDGGTDQDGGDDDGGGDSSGSDSEGGTDGGSDRSFTQDEVNRMLAKDRKKHQEANKKLAADLEKFKSTAQLTVQEKEDLEKRIANLKGEVESKEKLAQKDLAKTKKQFAEQLAKQEETAKMWEARFKQATLTRAITDAAVKHEAFDSGQIIALINSFNPEVVEDLDDEGNGKGTFTPKVKYQDTDKDGNPTTLTLDVFEAVKRMKENTSSYGNLFKDTSTGGLGGSSGTPGKDLGDIDFYKITPEEYRTKYRNKVLQ